MRCLRFLLLQIQKFLSNEIEFGFQLIDIVKKFSLEQRLKSPMGRVGPGSYSFVLHVVGLLLESAAFLNETVLLVQDLHAFFQLRLQTFIGFGQ